MSDLRKNTSRKLRNTLLVCWVATVVGGPLFEAHAAPSCPAKKRNAVSAHELRTIKRIREGNNAAARAEAGKLLNAAAELAEAALPNAGQETGLTLADGLLEQADRANQFANVVLESIEDGQNVDESVRDFVREWEQEVANTLVQKNPSPAYDERIKRQHNGVLALMRVASDLTEFRTWKTGESASNLYEAACRTMITTMAEGLDRFAGQPGLGSGNEAALARATVFGGTGHVPVYTDFFTNPPDGSHNVGNIVAIDPAWATVHSVGFQWFEIKDVDGYIQWLKDSYYSAGGHGKAPMHPTMETWIREYVNSNSVQSEKSFLSPSHNFGAPGAHAEVFAVNQALHAIGPNALTDGQIANIAVSTLKLKENLLDSDNYMTGSSFTTCRNCEGVLGGRGMFIMTGTGGIGSEVPNN